MYDTSNFRKGLKIEIDNVPWIIVDFQHVKPGKGGAFVRTRIKNLVTQQVIDRTFRSGDKVGEPDIEDLDCTYMYFDGEYNFMNLETYESFAVPADAVGDAKNFLVENLEVAILLYRGAAIALDLPNFIVAGITVWEPGAAGNTAQGATKTITIETGYVVQVPLYVKEDDRLKIDTRSGTFVERVKA